MLHFDSSWRFESPGKIPPGIESEFGDIIRKIAAGKQDVLEHFKSYFATASGSTSSWSSSASWADSDLGNYMGQAAENSALFIEAFYDACESLRGKHPVPDLQYINRLLSKYEANYRIEPPNLINNNAPLTAHVADIPISLDQKAQDIIQKSLKEGQNLISEGRYRLAVQEVLWLLETVTTAFQGLNNGEANIEGKYFNKIIEELKKGNQGSSLEQIMGWIIKLHGYLSAPMGGGIRHGMHLNEGVATTENEARLYFNLIVSYISFLLTEYDRLKSK
ncbi:MAG: hypothetical protein GXC78_10240 [Chitinophagaceae bacterium]|nr:hypothetical protein [Chitinophagaceae bacterium]